jgi:tetrapyrrole methylase family protein / MazG family protein
VNVEPKIQAGITFVGLGPGDAEQLTRQAWSWLQGAAEIAVRPNVETAALATEQGKLLRLGDGVDGGLTGMLADLMGLARQPGGITYVAPGMPFEGDELARLARAQALAEGLPVCVIGGVSLFDAARAAIGDLDGPAPFTVDVSRLEDRHVPPFPPTTQAMLIGIDAPATAGLVHKVLSQVYPEETHLQRVAPGQSQAIPILLRDIDAQAAYDPFDVWVAPALGSGSGLEDLQEIVAHLRAPNGCPWDREQTHLSLRKHLLEETYEALEALDAEDVPGMVEEFGDLLLQIVLHAQIASETGEFCLPDVIRGISDKLIRRHPHVFGDVKVDGVKGVLQNWERLKAAERVGNVRKKIKNGLLDGVPPIFPSLAQAQEIQDRAARVNFDWKDIQGVLEKIDEELEEVKNAPDLESKATEIGDLLFTVVNLARWEKVDAESALRETNARFRRRFEFIEAAAKADSVSLDELGSGEMNRLWDEAKRSESE